MDANEKINNFHQAFDDIIFSQSNVDNSISNMSQLCPTESQNFSSSDGVSLSQNEMASRNPNINQKNFNQITYPQNFSNLTDNNMRPQQNLQLDVMNPAIQQKFLPAQVNHLAPQNNFHPNMQLYTQQNAQHFQGLHPQQQMMMQNQFIRSQQPNHLTSSFKSLGPNQINDVNQFQANQKLNLANQPNTLNSNGLFTLQRGAQMPQQSPLPQNVNQNSIPQVFPGTQFNSSISDPLKNQIQQQAIKSPQMPVPLNQPQFVLQNCSVNNNRLNFCVRRGNLIQPFRLDHNTNTAVKKYEIRDIFYEELMWREDLDLQLRCFHHEDRFMRVNWPKDICVEVNDQKLEVDRSGDVWQQQPLLIKGVCHSGVNTLKVSVSSCACSHLFILQLIHRPTILDVMTLIMTKQRLDVTAVQKKLKTFFNKQAASKHSDGKSEFIRINRECPISKKPIIIPIRGNSCTHLQCFDLESYLFLNKERSLWRCPVCFASVLVEFIEVDDFMFNLLKNASPFSSKKINIYPDGQWKFDTGQLDAQTTASNPNNQYLEPLNGYYDQQSYSNGHFVLNQVEANPNNNVDTNLSKNLCLDQDNSKINNLSLSNKSHQLSSNHALAYDQKKEIDSESHSYKRDHYSNSLQSPSSDLQPGTKSSKYSQLNRQESKTSGNHFSDNQFNIELMQGPEDLDIQESIEKVIQQNRQSMNLNNKSIGLEERANMSNSIDRSIAHDDFDSLSMRYFDNENGFLDAPDQNIKFGAFDELDSEFVMN